MKMCPVSKKCGGCAYLQMPYEEQLQMKKEQVQKLFGKIPVGEIHGMEDPYHYRHKVYATFYRDRKEKMHAGIYEKNSHRLLDSSMCLIQDVKANQILQTICHIADDMHIEPYDEDRNTGVLRHAYIRVSEAEGTVLLGIVIGSRFLPGSKNFVSRLREAHPEIETAVLNYNHARTSMILGPKEDILFGRGYITDRISGLQFRISSKSFYQVNPVQTEKLYARAIGLARLKKTDTVLDMCCGIGTITLAAAGSCRQAVGVEINAEAIADAKVNAKINQMQNVSFYASDASEYMKRMKLHPDVIFFDPPRSGMSETALKAAGKAAPSRIVYVSCNPETQVRDIRILKSFGYRIQNLELFDLFPFTEHVETVCLLTHS